MFESISRVAPFASPQNLKTCHIFQVALSALCLAQSGLGQSSNFSVFDQKKVAVKPRIASSPAEPIDVQPQIHFDFDDPKEVRDSGKAHVSVTVTGTASAPGHNGLAREFSGEDSKITIDSDVSKFMVNEYTVACWVQPHQQGGYGLIFDLNGNYGVRLRLYGTSLNLNTGSQWHLIESESNSIKPEEWTHVAATCDSNVARLYVNGKLIGEKEVTQKLNFGTTATIGQGNRDRNADDTDTTDRKDSFLNGTIDDLRVYDIALSPEQIAALAK